MLMQIYPNLEPISRCMILIITTSKTYSALAIYELSKLVAPNNGSLVRMRDYENSMKWLSDTAILRTNPQITRKLSENKKPIMDWLLFTFQTYYDPYIPLVNLKKGYNNKKIRPVYNTNRNKLIFNRGKNTGLLCFSEVFKEGIPTFVI